MEVPELSLAPRQLVSTKSTNSLESENNFSKKRKFFQDYHHNAVSQTSLDLQLNDPLPLDWEQCLDLESGKMYYLNRKTLEKSWNFPLDEKTLDLELNISASFSDGSRKFNDSSNINTRSIEDMTKKKSCSQSSSSNMVALPCLNCHLLVILSKSSPSCPNCKYVHSLPTQQITTSPTQVSNNGKSLNTLSLLN